MWDLPVDNYKGPLHFLNDGDVVKLGEDELKIILVPGHSPGHICLYSASQNFAIGGDVLFLESMVAQIYPAAITSSCWKI
jgi:glyoxylase-like metal-dependent hydrolase (beta-lactamase superfamily II)